jgi:hypothetical protein
MVMSDIVVCRITEVPFGIILHFSFHFSLICEKEFSYLKIPRFCTLLQVTATRRRTYGCNTGKMILIWEKPKYLEKLPSQHQFDQDLER